MSDCIDRGLDAVRADQEPLRAYVKDIAEVAATLEPATQSCAERQQKFEALRKRFARTKTPIYQKMAQVMTSFMAGLFVGADTLTSLNDNLDLERWFRIPKSHERHIHGHRHAGIRIVLEGPTLVHALDAHVTHPSPFTVEDLLPYRNAQVPQSQQEAMKRRKIMKKARSKKQRPILMADLERRYRKCSGF